MSLPSDYNNCYFILYKNNEDGTIDSVYVKPIIRASKSSGQLLDFYGVRASKYGIKVPADAEGWAIIHVENKTPKRVISGNLPGPKESKIWELSDGRVVYIKRGTANISFSASMHVKKFRSVSE